MEKVTFRLKDPQNKKDENDKLIIPPSKQTESLIFMYFSYGYFELTATGEKKYIPLKYSTGLKVKPKFWKGKPDYRVKSSDYIDYEFINDELNNLENEIKKIHRKNKKANPSKLKEELNKSLDKSIPDYINLNLFLDNYLTGISNGTILTQKNELFKTSTIKGIKTFITTFQNFQNHKNRKYDFNDITIDFYNDFTLYLTSLNHSPNTIGKLVKQLKIVMRKAMEQGLHTNKEFENRAFKVINKEVENIALNEKEIEKLFNLDLSRKPNYDLARDVFLVGCYTAQRYSDYSQISKNNIVNGFIELKQKKTEEKVIIPIRPELKAILKKYNYNLPKTYEQKVNKYIKEIGKLAGLTDMVKTENTRGGLIIKQDVPKHTLIMTHTARRSGATNMYLAGIPSIDIMKLTGHKTEKEFLKYVKVSKKQTAIKLEKHKYFNIPLKKA